MTMPAGLKSCRKCGREIGSYERRHEARTFFMGTNRDTGERAPVGERRVAFCLECGDQTDPPGPEGTVEVG